MQIGEKRFEFGSHLGRLRFRCRSRSDEVVAPQSLGILRRQQPIHVAVAHYEARNLRPRLFHKPGAQMYVMPEVVDAQLQTFQSELGRIASKLGRQRLVCGASESEDGYAWHRWRSDLCSLRLAHSVDQVCAEWCETEFCFVTAPS